MNFSQSVHPRSKGVCVWKRNANTSQTDRKIGIIGGKNVRLTSESSDHSNLGDTQHTWNVKSSKSNSNSKPKKSKEEWMEIKSLAKHSTIASRLQLKKVVPVSFLGMNEKKSPKRDRNKSSFDSSTFDRIIDTQGNLTKSFKETKEFKSLNPHIVKDMDRMKKRVYSMYQKQRTKMNNFLVGNSTVQLDQHVTIENQRGKSISLMANYDEMQKISERQEYESRLNSTRVRENKGQQKNGQQSENHPVKSSFVKKQAAKYVEQPVYSFTKSSQKGKSQTKSLHKQPSISSTTTNTLLKGLLGEYSNYEKLPKHQLIQKLISLEYLAQNIFKKNKFLQEELEKKQIQLKPHISNRQRNQQSKGQSRNKSEERMNPFIINNDDGYFNEFLDLQKGRQLEGSRQVQEEPQRFREDQKVF